MITMVDTIETAIIEKLKADIPDLPVSGFPDSPSGFKALPFTHGLILVAYRSSNFSTPTNRDKIIQERDLEFSITLQIRDLRSHNGAYSYLKAINTSLSGFSPMEDLRVMYQSEEVFLNFTSNIWTWGQTWKLGARQA